MHKYIILIGTLLSSILSSFAIAAEEEKKQIPLSPGLTAVDPAGVWDPKTPPRDSISRDAKDLTPQRYSFESPGSSSPDTISLAPEIPSVPPGLGFMLEDHDGIKALETYAKDPANFRNPEYVAPSITYTNEVTKMYPAGRGPVVLLNPRQEIVHCMQCRRFDIAYRIALDTKDYFSQSLVLVIESEASIGYLYNPYIAIEKISNQLWDPDNASYSPVFYHLLGRARLAAAYHERFAGRDEQAQINFFAVIQLAKELKDKTMFMYAFEGIRSIL